MTVVKSLNLFSIKHDMLWCDIIQKGNKMGNKVQKSKIKNQTVCHELLFSYFRKETAPFCEAEGLVF